MRMFRSSAATLMVLLVNFRICELKHRPTSAKFMRRWHRRRSCQSRVRLGPVSVKRQCGWSNHCKQRIERDQRGACFNQWPGVYWYIVRAVCGFNIWLCVHWLHSIDLIKLQTNAPALPPRWISADWYTRWTPRNQLCWMLTLRELAICIRSFELSRRKRSAIIK